MGDDWTDLRPRNGLVVYRGRYMPLKHAQKLMELDEKKRLRTVGDINPEGKALRRG